MKLVWMMAGAAVMSGCAGSMGGPGPVVYSMVAVDAGQAAAEATAAQIGPAQADFALVVAPGDSAWFTRLAAATGLAVSGPAMADRMGLAFLSNLEVLGDTSIVIGTGDAAFTMQDALYQASDQRRYLDLMLVNLPAGVNVDGAIRALLEYMATDVMADASVVLGVRAATVADANRVETMLRAAFMNAVECGGMDGAQRTYRIFFGPSARTRCTTAQPLPGPADAITARVSVGLHS